MDIFYSFIGFFSRGGLFMLPILFVGALGAAIALERFITLTRMSVRNHSAWTTLDPVLMKGEFDKAREMTGKDDTAISRLIGVGLSLQGAVRRRDDVKTAMQECMTGIMPQL